MTTQQSLHYLLNKAITLGYDESQLNPFLPEIRECIEQLDDWDEESLNDLFDTIF